MAKIHDVARRAMVPLSAVSLVLENESTSEVGASQKRMILDAVRSTGFNGKAARHTRGDAATRVLGLIVPLRGAIFLNHFVAEVLAGVQTCLMERGYHLMIYTHGSATGGMTDAERQQSRSADGVIVFNTRLCSEQDMRDTIDDLKSAAVPFVMLNGRPAGEDFSYIGVDEYEVGYLAGEYLIAEGHRRIAILGGSQRNPTGQRLLKGMVDACRAHKLAARFPLHDFTEYDHGRIGSIVSGWMSSRQAPTAICCDDPMASEVYEALDALRLRVPKDVAVLGRGDLAFASTLKPKLTTVRIPAMEIGRLAAEQLISQIENHDAQSKSIVVPCSVTVRDSA